MPTNLVLSLMRNAYPQIIISSPDRGETPTHQLFQGSVTPFGLSTPVLALLPGESLSLLPPHTGGPSSFPAAFLFPVTRQNCFVINSWNRGYRRRRRRCCLDSFESSTASAYASSTLTARPPLLLLGRSRCDSEAAAAIRENPPPAAVTPRCLLSASLEGREVYFAPAWGRPRAHAT